MPLLPTFWNAHILVIVQKFGCKFMGATKKEYSVELRNAFRFYAWINTTITLDYTVVPMISHSQRTLLILRCLLFPSYCLSCFWLSSTSKGKTFVKCAHIIMSGCPSTISHDFYGSCCQSTYALAVVLHWYMHSGCGQGRDYLPMWGLFNP
jgi:hypothetical protein